MKKFSLVLILILCGLFIAEDLKADNHDGLPFSIYFGGSGFDEIECLKRDSLGNIFICGSTASEDFPASDSAFCDINKSAPYGYTSCFLAKFDSLGNLIFSTFWGGYWDDYAKDFAIARNGDFVVTGYTASKTTFPRTIGAFDSLGNAGYDAFVCRLSSDGRRLIYSTTIGGDKDDYALAVELDDSDNPYIVGYSTENGGFPVTSGCLQSRGNGKYDVFISKFNSNASNLIFSTYLGGSADDMGQDLTLDSAGNAYIIGTTRSSNFPTTQNAYSRILNDSAATDKSEGDMFLTKISADGANLQYSSYIGGKNRDVAYEILNRNHNLYIAGYSESRDFPTTENVACSEYSAGKSVLSKGDVVCLKVNQDSLAKIQFSTFIGGSGTDRVWDMSLDDSLNITLTGTTSSPDFYISKNAVDSALSNEGDGTDAFIVKISSNAEKIIYGSYLGGENPDVGKSVWVVNDSVLWLGGITSSPDFPVTNTNNSTPKGEQDIFLSRIVMNQVFESLSFELDITGGLLLSENYIYLCQSDSIFVKLNFSGDIAGIPSVQWTNAEDVMKISDSLFVIIPKNSGKFIVSVYDVAGNTWADTLEVEFAELPDINIIGPKNALKNSRCEYFVINDDNLTYLWEITGGTIVEGQNTSHVVVDWAEEANSSLCCTATNLYGCYKSSGKISINIGENFSFEFGLSDPYMMCKGDTLLLSPNEIFAEYLWSDGTTESELPVTAAGKYWLRVTNDAGFFGYSDTVTVLTKSSPQKPQVGLMDSLLQCMIVAPAYQWYLNGKILPGDTLKSIVLRQEGDYRVQITANNGCKAMSDVFKYSSIKENVKNPIIKYNIKTNVLSLITEEDVFFNGNLKIFNVLGEEIYSCDIVSNEVSLGKIGLQNNVIFVVIYDKNHKNILRQIILL